MHPRSHSIRTPPLYAWIVFLLTVGLLLSDYMTRQVLSALFPALKAQWHLSDAQLGALSSVVALLVGGLTFPLSLIADRYGKVRSVLVMAIIWSIATIACAFAQNYRQMFGARLFIGIGEAAYGSVGLALIIGVFPHRMRSTLTAIFMAGGPVGSIVGIAGGGWIAAHFGWRSAFAAMASGSFALTGLYALLVREKRLIAPEAPNPQAHSHHRNWRTLASQLPKLISSPALVAAYLASGFQLFLMSALMAWLPSYFARYYAWPTSRVSTYAALFLLIGALGMVLCGIVADQLSMSVPTRKWRVAQLYAAVSALLLAYAFQLRPGGAQLLILGAGMFLVSGSNGPVGALVINALPPSLHATALALVAVCNNLLGIAPGPFLTGWLADKTSLVIALQWMPMVALATVLALGAGRNHACHTRVD